MGSNIQGNGRVKEKGHVSKIFHLSQNFRTHAGVLKLAQSVVDLLYRFFPTFVDILSHETSLIYGEAPILLESGNDENAIITIFGNNGNVGSGFVGFGAEQVILVRDDSARKEISKYVGKQALVLTIVECKGLEFQDVLLYNFFGTSPLRNKWRVLYQYMSEQCLLDAGTQQFQIFNQSKHNILCSELKQLYVAITRTRQRLWICENSEEFSKPMFDYWRKKGLIQVRKLDDSLAKAMQVASSPEEWKSQGYKLLREGNYEMATMCFERGGDEYGEKLAKATGLRASADKMHSSNPETASIARRQAAEIFEAIGKDENAAECFFLLKEYERAGKIYLKCGESSTERAGECLYLAGCYELAAEVYANYGRFSKCLKACSEGRLFEKGLQYVQCWKQNAGIKRSTEIDRIEQEFLLSCALHYHERNDKRAMMKYVRAFDSVASIRDFLKKLGCIDELLSYEEESSNFLEAANIAKLRGELLREADLLGKAGNFKDASSLILWYVFARSLWSSRSKGWPLKKFEGMGDLLAKAKSFAAADSEQFSKFVHMEADILLNDQSSLLTMKQQMIASHENKSIRGEILSARKILDVHLKLNDSKYNLEDRVIPDLAMFSKNQVSASTLFHHWNFWMEKIVIIFEYLRSPEAHVNDVKVSGEFCLNYLGVHRHLNNRNPVYNLMIPGAFWAKEMDLRHMRRNGEFISLDVHQFASGAQSYWCSELLSVGIDVLAKLEALYNHSMKNGLSLICQSSILCDIYQVADFLLSSKFLDRKFRDNRAALRKFVELPSQNLVRCVCPLDWRESMNETMISLRTEKFGNFVKNATSGTVSISKRVSYGQLGRILVAILSSKKPDIQFFEKIKEGFRWNPSWMDLIVVLCSTQAEHNEAVLWNLHGVLQDIYNVNWRKVNDYISPDCFIYLVERQLFLVSCTRGHFTATKSSFTEILVYLEHNGSSISRLQESVTQPFNAILEFLAHIVQQFLVHKADTMEWIEKSHSNLKDCYGALTLRLAVIACLLYLNYGIFGEHLFDMLGLDYIKDQLPRELLVVLDIRRKLRTTRNFNGDIEMFFKVFKKIGNPLVVVSLGEKAMNFPDGIFIDVINQSKEDMWTVLFPNLVEKEAVEMNKGLKSVNERECKKISSFHEDGIMEMFRLLRSMINEEYTPGVVTSAIVIKEDVLEAIIFYKAALDLCCVSDEKEDAYGEASIMVGQLSELYFALSELFSALDVSEPELVDNMPRIGQLLSEIESKMPTVGSFVNQLFSKRDDIIDEKASETCPSHEEEVEAARSENSVGNRASGSQGEKKGKGKGKKKKNKGKGKRKG